MLTEADLQTGGIQIAREEAAEKRLRERIANTKKPCIWDQPGIYDRRDRAL